MLKVDMYVRIVLTVIAISLAVIAFGPVFNTPAGAREVGRPTSIAITEGRGGGYLMLWLAGDNGIELVEFTDVGRVNETHFISYDNLSKDNWISGERRVRLFNW